MVPAPWSNPALIDGLADAFVKSGYDLKAIVRMICLSSAYQLTSEPNEHNASDRQNYSRFFPRRLPAEVLLDAIDTVTGVPTKFPSQPSGSRAVAAKRSWRSFAVSSGSGASCWAHTRAAST